MSQGYIEGYGMPVLWNDWFYEVNINVNYNI
jgi:hypothetical protein